MKYSVELNEAQAKALATVALNPADWIQNAASERARVAYDEICRNEIDRLLAAGQPIPPTKDEIVLGAPVESAAERQARLDSEAGAAAGQDVAAQEASA
jgi:hypothetical protein